MTLLHCYWAFSRCVLTWTNCTLRCVYDSSKEKPLLNAEPIMQGLELVSSSTCFKESELQALRSGMAIGHKFSKAQKGSAGV
ncbi:hypothetical protein K474DRAFT_1669823 [Panus rudis PR-1116 ss-1]|nr:hypothetical protein K474DRAFT_1669823 [Panus rudis PR-1116 ss-1]